MIPGLTEIWQKAQEPIRDQVGSTTYETWFTSLQIKEKNPQTLIIETPDTFFKNWIVEHYEEKIKEIVQSLSSAAIQIEFSVNSSIFSPGAQSSPSLFEPTQKEAVQTPSNLNSRFTFENFVIGSSNRFACAAGLAVAESPARAYNPLFIYGQVGLGKTHLIQAITHKIYELNPHLKLSYMSSEKFTNELIDAIRHRSTVDFRKKYRDIDVLLIDDIQFIAGKESTQEEFFHTFNNLHNNKKQIIITSDRPPKEISNLEERLSSRFAWGLITDIQPPDFETRLAILRKKVEGEAVKVPEEINYYIAEQIKTNIRELEGALIRVTAYAMLEGSPLTLEMAKIVLKDMVKESSKTISVEMIQKAVTGFYQIPLSDLRSKRRNKNIVLARQVAMYLARKLSNMSFPEIGNAFGGKDHTTVLHSCKKIEQAVSQNNEIKNAIEQISRGLKH